MKKQNDNNAWREGAPPGGGGDLRGEDWLCWASGDTSAYAALSPSIAMNFCTRGCKTSIVYVYVEREMQEYMVRAIEI